MVFFTCNHCGESVKKSAVEKHYNTKCRGAMKSVSCMDCLKDFREEEYVAHTKCISEAQKYSGRDYVHKESKNSGAKKQESWMNIIRAILDSTDYKLSKQARSAFQLLQSYDNVPQKKVKFQNFVKNCLHMPVRLAAEVWCVLEKEQEKIKVAKQLEKPAIATKVEEHPNKNGVKHDSTEENGHEKPLKKKIKKEKKGKNGTVKTHTHAADEDVEPAKKPKKAAEDEVPVVADTNGNDEPPKKKPRKQKTVAEEVVVLKASSDDTILEANGEAGDNFEWCAVLEKIVLKNAKGIHLEKLKKRVLKKYAAKLGADELTEKQQKKFEKKLAKSLKKSANLQVEGDIVKAC